MEREGSLKIGDVSLLSVFLEEILPPLLRSAMATAR